MKKASRYCAVFNCLKTDRDNDITLFRLPRDVERTRRWLIAIDREELLNRKNFKHTSYYVCSLHFKKSDLKNVQQLCADAIPTKCLPNELQETLDAVDTCTQTEPQVQINEPIKEETESSIETETENIESSEEKTQTAVPVSKSSPRKRKITEELKKSKRKRRQLEKEIKKIHDELEAKNAPIIGNDPDEEINYRFKKLIEWQNKLKNKFKGNRYDAEYNMFALNLHYSSPQAYRCLQTVLKLPSTQALCRLKLNIPPKLDNRVLETLVFKIQSMPDNAKYCTLCVDKIKLKRNLCYDTKTDEVIGFHNINGKVTPEIASNAYVIMLQGIYFEWKQPIAYALLASAKNYEELDEWLNEVISNLSGIGIHVKAIISGQGSNFDNFAKEVKKVTIDKPYFMIDGEKIYYIFDVPNLIKCIRNNLLTNDFYCNGNKISWDYIKLLYEEQKEKNLRLIPKITESHIEPSNFKKMRLKYAVQILSRTVSSALHTYIDLKKMPEDARPTANFIESTNNLFDVLNSSQIKCSNKYQISMCL